MSEKYVCALYKYYEEMKQAGVQATKRIYMSLIDAYAASGQFEKAKQVGMHTLYFFVRSRKWNIFRVTAQIFILP